MVPYVDVYVQDGDQTWVHTIARSLVNLQQLFGLIPNTYGIGRCAKVSSKIFVVEVWPM